MSERVALLRIPDLMFAAQVGDALKALGLSARDVRAEAPLEQQMPGTALLIVQLSGPREAWMPLIVGAKSAGVPVLAFGAHVDAETLRAARQAGADRAVPNSQLATELPALVSSLVNL
jgi:DNA-binding NarL/FixJ family response regulator